MDPQLDYRQAQKSLDRIKATLDQFDKIDTRKVAITEEGKILPTGGALLGALNKVDYLTWGYLGQGIESSLRSFSGEDFEKSFEGLNRISTEIEKDLKVVTQYVSTALDRKDQNACADLEGRVSHLLSKIEDVEDHFDNLIGSYSKKPAQQEKLRKKLEELDKSLEVNLRSLKEKLIPVAEPTEPPKASSFKPVSAEAAKKEFQKSLTPKNVAHLVGDAFAAGMRNEYGEKVEGNSPSDSMNFLLAAIDHLPRGEFKHPDINNKLAYVKEKVQKAKEIAELLELAGRKYWMNLSTEHISSKMHNTLDTLENGETFVMPWGWTSNATGHAMLVVFKRVNDDLKIRVINTGSGGEYHEGFTDNAKLFVNTIENFRISYSDLKKEKIIERMLEPEVLPLYSEMTDDNTSIGAADLYALLHKYRVLSNQDTGQKVWMKSQLSGFCSIRAWLAYMALVMGEDYKTFKSVWERETIKSILDNEKKLTEDPLFKSMVAKSLPNLFRQQIKILKKNGAHSDSNIKILNELEVYLEKFKKIFPEASSYHPTISTDLVNLINITSALKAKVNKAPAPITEKKGYKPYVSSNPVTIPDYQFLTNEKMDGTMLKSWLDNFQDFVKQYQFSGQNPAQCQMKALAEIGRLFTNPQYDKQKKQVIESLKNDPKGCNQVIDFLINTQFQLNENLKKQNANYKPITQLIANMSALCSAREICILLDNIQGLKEEERIDYFGMRLDELKLEEESKLPVIQYLDPQYENDYSNLKAYLVGTANQNDLFRNQFKNKNFDQEKRVYKLQLDPRSSTYAYASAHAKKTTSWIKSDIDYQKEIFGKRSNLTKSDWHVHWLYRHHYLPSHFEKLQKMYYALNSSSIFKKISIHPTPKLEDELLQDLKIELEDSPPVIYVKADDGDFVNDQKDTFDTDSGIRNKCFGPTGVSFINNTDENTIATHSQPKDRELKSLLVMKTPLQVSMIIDQSRKNLDSLTRIHVLTTFYAVLFRNGLLKEVISWKKPAVTEDLLSFIDEAISYYKNRINPMLSQSDTSQTHAFLLNFKQRILNYVKVYAKDQSVDKEIEKTRKEIIDCQKLKGYQTDNILRYLTSAYIESFSQNTSLSLEDSVAVSENLARFWRVNNADQMEIISGDMINLVNLTMASLSPIMKDHVNKQPQKFIDKILPVYELNPQDFNEWNVKQYPILIGRGKNKEFLEIDVLNGSAKLLGDPISFNYIPDEYINDDFKLAVSPRAIPGKMLPGYFEGSDKFSKIRVQISREFDYSKMWTKNTHHIQREFGGRWYEYKKIDDFDKKLLTLPGSVENLLFPSLNHPDSKDLLLWQSTDKNYPEVCLVDKTTFEIKFKIDADGYLRLGDFKARYIWSEAKESHPYIHKFSPDHIILVNVDTRQTEMLFPSYVQNGECLRFIKKEIELADKSKKIVWAYNASPNLFISQDQSLRGVDDLRKYLIIENTKGEKEVIIPQYAYEETHPKLKRVFYGAPPEDKGSIAERSKRDIPFTTYRIKEGAIAKQTEVHKNLYLAYLNFTHAKVPDDYLRALEFLESSGKLSAYTDNELKILAWIINPDKIDAYGDAFAIRLYAAWLIKHNLSTYPTTHTRPQNPPHRHSPSNIWAGFCQDLVHRNSQTLSIIVKGYFERQNNVQDQLNIHKLIPKEELDNWNVPTILKPIKQQKIQSPITPTDLLSHYQPKKYPKPNYFNTKASAPPFAMRLGKSFENYYQYLFDNATSPYIKKRKEVMRLIRDSQYDKYNTYSRLYLTIALLSSEVDHPLRFLAVEFTKLVKYLSAEIPRDNVVKETEEVRKWKELYRVIISHPDFVNYYTSLNRVSDQILDSNYTLPQRQTQKIETRDYPAELPKTVPTTDPIFDYKMSSEPFKEANQVAKKYFKDVPQKEQLQPQKLAFIYKVAPGSLLEKAVGMLNKEIELGRQRNEHSRNNELILSPEDSARGIFSNRLTMEAQQIKDITTLRTKKSQIEHLLNQKLTTDPLLRAEVGGKKRRKLTLDDAFLLVLKGDFNKIAATLGTDDQEVIKNFIHQTHEYLQLSVKMIHDEIILEKIQELENVTSQPHTEKELINALQAVASVMKEKHDLSGVYRPFAIHLFEHKISESKKIILKDDQIKGLDDMMKRDPTDPLKVFSTFVHRIQAGGKTLIWGQIGAEMKADGYHLSLHVSPTQQYGTNLPDMAHRSKSIFNQKVNTLVFDDRPEYFQNEYLDLMYFTLKKSIFDREYVNTTIESLRSLRDKYIKNELEIHNTTIVTEAQKKILDLKNDNAGIYGYMTQEEFLRRQNLGMKLEQILGLLRERGIFTFDEVHLAMEARKSLDMSVGVPDHPDPIETHLIKDIIKIASESTTCKLKENLQSQQTGEQRKQMLKNIVDQLLKDPELLKILNIQDASGRIDERRLEKVKQFINTKDAYLPEFYDRESKVARLVTLAHCMIGENWLADALTKNVYEHHGIVQKPNSPPISGPFVANKTPALGSEFSDEYVKSTFTFIAYMVEGISTQQVQEAITQLKDNIAEEYRVKKMENPDFTVDMCESLQEFTRFLEASNMSNLSLYNIDITDNETLEKFKNALNANNSVAIDFMLKLISANVIRKMDLYRYNVSTNGQHTTSMAKAVVAYSGSMDNPNMAPIIGLKPEHEVRCEPEVGVNGQTIDLVVNKNNEVWVIGSDPQSIFTDLIDKLEPEKRKRVRALIDVGCHFRGKNNYDIAVMVAERIKNNDIKGIVFADNITGELRFFPKDNPTSIKALSGSSYEAIETETGLPPENLFMVYTQDKVVGTDVKNMKNAIGIPTVSENTELPLDIQGRRRMRELDEYQELITAVQQGALDKIGDTVGKKEVKVLPIGKVENPDFIKDVLVFEQVNELNKQIKDNLQFCLQKMNNFVEQYLLDGIYQGKFTSKEVFTKAAELFLKKVGVDLVNEYSQSKVDIDMRSFLNKIQGNFIHFMKVMNAPADDIVLAKTAMQKLIEKSLKDLEEKIAVHTDFKKDKVSAAQPINREATMVQCRAVENENKKTNTQQQQNQNILALDHHSYTKDYKDIPLEAMIAPRTRPDMVDQVGKNVKNLQDLISPEIIYTQNYGFSRQNVNTIDIGDKHQKPSFNVLLVKYPDNTYRMVLGTIADMDRAAKEILSSKTPDGIQAWVLRPNGELASPNPFDFNSKQILVDPKLKSLFLQMYFITGNLHELRKPVWTNALKEWIDNQKYENKLSVQHLFEENFLHGLNPPEYKFSALPSILKVAIPVA